MKKIFPLLFILSLGWLYVGCSDDDNEFTALNIISSDVEFQAPGGSGKITFLSGSTVTAQANQNWLTLGAPGAESITYEVAPNNDMMARVGAITLSVDGVTETIVINQMGTILDVKEVYTISPASETTTFDLYENSKDITVAAADPWVNVSIIDGRLQVISEIYMGVVPRSTTLTFTSGWKTVTSILTQSVLIDTSDLYFASGAGTQTFDIHTAIDQIDPSWTVESDATWLNVSKSDYKISAQASRNTTGTYRTATITVKVRDAVIEIPVFQSSIANMYQYILGEWTIVSNNTRKLTFNQKVANQSYTLTGMGGDLLVTYDSQTRQMRLESQYVANMFFFHLFFCPANAETGYITWADGAGFILSYDEITNSITFTDNGVWGTYTANSIAMQGFTSATPSESTIFGTIYAYLNIEGLFR